MADPNDVITTKRTINHRTKQIETRIQRQIVIEDGRVVSDTGPLVTTKTLEDNKEEIDEIEHKYAYCQGANAAATEREPKLTPRKTFIFGAEQGQPRSCHHEAKDASFQSWKTNKPSKYFYFGQNGRDGKEKEKENVQQQVNSKLTKQSKDDGHSISRTSSNVSGEEKDCQFVYEYSDFSRHSRERTWP